jgi:hypothetical protein
VPAESPGRRQAGTGQGLPGNQWHRHLLWRAGAGGGNIHCNFFAYINRYGHACEFPDQDCYADEFSDAHADQDSYRDSYCNKYRAADRHEYCRALIHQYSCKHGATDRYRHNGSDRDGYRYTYSDSCSDFYADRDEYGGADAGKHGCEHAAADGHKYGGNYRYKYARKYIAADRHKYARINPGKYVNKHGAADRDAYGGSDCVKPYADYDEYSAGFNSDCDKNTNRYGNFDTYRDIHCYGHPYCDPDSDGHVYSHGHAYRKSYGNCHAYKHARARHGA